MKTVSAITAIIVLIGMFFGVYRYIDTRYALAEEVKKIEQRLDYKISDDQRISMQQEMRQIEERNLGKTIDKWDKRDRARYNEIRDQLAKVEERIKKLVK